MGTAYRTRAASSAFATETDSTAVFAIWPPVIYGREFESATYLLVTSSDLSLDTVVFPCDAGGQLKSWTPIVAVKVRNHASALRAAGYDMELVMPHGA